MNLTTILKQIEPCPARGSFKQSLYTDPNYWAEEKYDGDRRLAHFVSEANRFTGRRLGKADGLFVEKTLQVPHLSQGGRWKELEGTILDGEFLVPGGRSKDVTSIVGSKPEEAVRKQQERGWLQYVVFDCLFYRGADLRGLPLQERREWLQRAADWWANDHVRVATKAEMDREAFLAGIWERGGEGIILKDRRAAYGQHLSWVKVKSEFTEDVVVMGYEEPEQFTKKVDGTVSESRLWKNGWIGAVKFGQYKDGVLTPCGSCYGMSDAVLAEISANREKYLGEPFSIKANEREPSGAFRHPRWAGWRPDLEPTRCVWRTERPAKESA